MTGRDIPTITVHIIGRDGKEETIQRPVYTLRSAEDVKAEQDRLGDNASWYYGTHCERCCGVFPAFETDEDLSNKGYYVCLVCGKESQHEPMQMLARIAWNEHRFKWQPTGFRQMTIFDLMQEEAYGD